MCRYTSPDQLQDGLATLSGLPTSYLNSFLQLDLVRERNKQATAAGGASRDGQNSRPILPFFMPVVETSKGISWLDDSTQPEDPDDVEDMAANRKRRRSTGGGEDRSLTSIEHIPNFAARLQEARTDVECE